LRDLKALNPIAERLEKLNALTVEVPQHIYHREE
jgi:hypothetical protein